MLRRVLTRASFYDGFITVLGIGVAVFMLYPFAYYFRPIDHWRTAVIFVMGFGFLVTATVLGTISRVRRLARED